MAIQNPQKKDEEQEVPGYVEQAQNSPGMRVLRSVGQALTNVAARRDAAMANMSARMPSAAAPPAAPTPAAAPAPRSSPARAPDFSNVQASPAITRPRPPASNPAAPAPQAGASAPAGGVRPPQVYVNDAGRTAAVPDGLQRTVVNGVPTYTRQGAPQAVATAPVAMPQPVAAPVQQTPVRTDIQMPRAPVADAYNTREANEERKALQAQLDSLAFRNSFAAGRGSKSARALQGDIIRTMAELSGQGLRAATDVAGGNRDATLRQNIAGFEQEGANVRADLEQAGALQRAGLEQQGANYRAGLEIARPQYVTDTEGNFLSVSGTGAQPVTGADGSPVQMPRTRDTVAGEVTPAVRLEALVSQLDAEQQSLTPNTERIAQLQAQIDAAVNGGGAPAATNVPAAGAVVKGYRFKGGDPSKRENWEKVQ